MRAETRAEAGRQEYQLRGEVDGRDRRFRLVPGANRCGNLPAENEIGLAASGVSRQHAVIEVGPRHLVLEDLGSKNGTFLNGRLVRRAHLRVGDEIGIGELKLRLERLEADDAALGLELSAPAAPAPAFLERETSRLIQDVRVQAVAPWLELVDALVERLLASPAGDLTGVLQLVAEALEARACVLVERASGGTAGILAAAGEVADRGIEPGLEAFLDATRERPAAGAVAPARAFAADGAAPVTGRALLPAERPALGLLVVGEVTARAEVASLLTTLLRLIAHLAAPARRGAGPIAPGLAWPEGYVPGASAAMAALHDQVRALAPAELPVLIVGETGVGKELVVRMLHASSPRRQRALVALNCAAIPRDLLEAELFGVEKGVATGVARRPGIFRRADGGTLFLDEIGDMPVELQAKLLRALQEREIRPLGGVPQAVDVRVVSATNLDLHARLGAGSFRADLYYRLAGYTLPVPPLRQRTEDLPGLVEHFLRGTCEQLGKSVRGVTVKALRALIRYPWPGNVRELEHEVRRLATLCGDGQAIDFEMLSAPVRSGTPELELAAGSHADEENLDLAEHEKRLILRALEAAGGQLTAASRLLGISRDALRRRLARHGLRDNPS
ncbi:MAG: FHA domain-containing protein [bacterium]|nr:FHA domain-containing protein [bacterium]